MSARCTECGADVAIDEQHLCAPAPQPWRNIYIAAPLALAPFCVRFAERAEAADFTVTSSWHDAVAVRIDGGERVRDPLEEPERKDIAETCLHEIQGAVALVVFTHEGEPRGTLVEVGAALMDACRVIWVQREGAPRTVFDSHQLVRRVVVAVGATEDEVLALSLEVLDGMRGSA